MRGRPPMSSDSKPSDSTIVAHDGAFPYGAVVPPIVQTSLFTFESYQDLVGCFRGENDLPIYSRGYNPTVREFEKKLAALEDTDDARALSSGMAAISSAVLSQVRSGERILCVRNVYPDAYRLFVGLLPRFGIAVDFVDGRDLNAVAAALPGCRLFYIESPTSWVFETLDLESLAEMARAQGVVTVVDNSWATPIFQKPCTHGIDMVVHSASKFIGGHSDTIAGVIAGRQDIIDAVNAYVAPYLGGKLAPFEAWLLIRGLRTLPIRMAQHDRNCRAIAERLRDHLCAARIYHPGLEGRGQQTLTGCSSLMAFEATDSVDVPKFCDSLKMFKLGVSWGGHESLAVPAMAALEQQGGPNSAQAFGVPPQLVRLHVGLEDVDDLWGDLSQALTQGGSQ